MLQLRALVLVSASILVAATAPPLGAQSPNEWIRIDSVFAADLQRSGAPGGVMALVRGDSVVHVVALGVRSIESMDPVTPATLFRVASTTKMLTGLAAAELSVAGVLDMSRPISRYVTVAGPRLGRVTMGQLLSHTAGLRDAATTVSGPHPTSLRAAASAMTDDLLFAPPGEIYSYANPGFTLAGYVIERASGKPYQEVVATRVLQPLGMTRSTFSPLVAMTWPLALGHARDSAATAGRSVLRPFVDDAALLPRGGLISTAGDMARLLIALMNDGRIGGRQAVSAAAVAAMETPRATMPDDSANHYGYGLRVVRNRGRREIGHYGGGLGYSAVIRGLVRERVGVVILANLDDALLNATANTALAQLAPAPSESPRPISAPSRTPITGREATLLAGRYRNGGGDLQFRFVVERDSLVLLDDDAKLMVMRTSDQRIAAVDADGAVAIEWTVVPAAGRPKYIFAFGRAFRRE